MATTQVVDGFNPRLYAKFLLQETTKLSPMYRSGMIVEDPRISAKISGDGGEIMDIPSWNDPADAGEPNIGSDDPGQHATHEKITSVFETAVTHPLNKSWSVMDLAAEIFGDNPMRLLAAGRARYWAIQLQRKMIATCQGVTAANVAGNADMVESVAQNVAAAAVTDAMRASQMTALNTMQTMGDHAEMITAIAMHSAIKRRYDALGLIETVQRDDNLPAQKLLFGKEIIVTDQLAPITLPNGALQFDTYFFGPGVFREGTRLPEVPAAFDRSETAGNGSGEEFFVNRMTKVLHFTGHQFTRAVMTGGRGPNNSDLAQAANYTRVFERKRIPFAVMRTNG